MRKPFALFDFDGTLIHGDSIILFMRYAWQNKLCSFFDLLRFIIAGGLFTFGLMSPKRAKEMGLRFLKGQDRVVFAKAAEAFCETVLKPRLYPQALEAIRRHQAAGEPVLLVSASPAFYLEPLKDMLQFTAVLGTQFETDSAGRFTGGIVGINCRGDEKPLRLKEYFRETGEELDFDRSSAYGDSVHDLPMLNLCKHAHAVNPRPTLRRKLRAAGGVTIVSWKEKP